MIRALALRVCPCCDKLLVLYTDEKGYQITEYKEGEKQ